MSSKVQLTAQTTDSLYGSVVRRPVVEAQPAPASEDVDSGQADMRLIIEDAGASGRYVYKVVDRRTGEIVSQLPREEVLKLRDQEDYAAGTVFDGKA